MTSPAGPPADPSPYGDGAAHVAQVGIVGEVLVSDYADRILMVGTDERTLRLPGAAALPGEGDWRAASRGAHEETGLRLHPHRLLAKDWLPSEEGNTGELRFVYLAGRVPDRTPITLPAPDTDAPAGPQMARWIALTNLAQHCTAPTTRRITAASWAARTGTLAELERGHHLHQKP